MNSLERAQQSRRTRVTCVDCQHEGWHEGRNLCTTCYARHQKRRTLDLFPRVQARSADLVEDWEFLRRQGYTRALAAERMGISKKRLEKAIERESRRLQVAS